MTTADARQVAEGTRLPAPTPGRTPFDWPAFDWPAFDWPAFDWPGDGGSGLDRPAFEDPSS